MPHHWNKLKVETEIFASGMSFTILQPAAYMQNILAYWPKIVSEGVYTVPYSAETRVALVDLEDVADAAVKVILEPGFRNGVYELVGTPAFTQTEIAQKISAKMGRSVRVETISRMDWEENARKNGMPEYAIQNSFKDVHLL